MGRSVLVTGASGFVGAHVCRAILAAGGRPVALMRRPRLRSPLHTLGIWERVSVALGDPRDRATVRRVLVEHELDGVVHLSGQPLPGVARANPPGTFEANVASAWSVLDAAREVSVRGVVMLSTSKVYAPRRDTSVSLLQREADARERLDPYGASKRCAEVLAEGYRESYGLPVVTLRLANTYGPGDGNRQRLVPAAIDCALGGRVLSIHGDGTQPLDMLYIDDAVRGILTAYDRAAELSQPVYNLGTGAMVTVRDVVDAVRVAVPRMWEPVFGEMPPNPTAALDVAAFHAATGFRPTVGLGDGIAATVNADRLQSRYEPTSD